MSVIVSEESVQVLLEMFPDRVPLVREIINLVEENANNNGLTYDEKMEVIFNLLSDQRDGSSSQGTQPNTSGTSTSDGGGATPRGLVGYIHEQPPFGNFSGNDRALNENYMALCNLFTDACPDYLWTFCRKRPHMDLDAMIDELTTGGYDKIVLDPSTIWYRLREALPNADPSYLETEANKFAQCNPENIEARLDEFLTNAIENSDYPTMDQYVRNQSDENHRKLYYEAHFNPVNYLEIIPNPEETFQNPNHKTPLSDADTPLEDLNYAKVFLYNAYPYIRKRHIDIIFNRKKDRLIECVEELDYIKKGLKKARPTEKVPCSKNIPLLQEVAYLRHRRLLKRFIKHKDDTYRQIKEEARKCNVLETCSICYDDELIPEECFLCTKNCIFCKECVRKGAETRIGYGYITFPCFICDGMFADRMLQMALPKNSFDRLVQRIQSEEIKKANVEGLETCPYCYYACVPPEDSIVFECKNEDCMKKSCRKCKHESHIPLKCKEIEYDEDVRRRTFIENKMTEALTRRCHSCKKLFVKTTGCNKMTCPCGAKMCYLCSQPVENYDHFSDTGCPLMTDDNQINLDRIRRQAEKAKQELGNVEIKFDPTVGIENFYRAQ